MNEAHEGTAADHVLVSNLRSRRELLGLTQGRVAKELKAAGLRIDQSGLSRIENGERAFTVGEALTYARVLGTTLEELLQPNPEDLIIAKVQAAHRSWERIGREAEKVLYFYQENLKDFQKALANLREEINRVEPGSAIRLKLEQTLRDHAAQIARNTDYTEPIEDVYHRLRFMFFNDDQASDSRP